MPFRHKHVQVILVVISLLALAACAGGEARSPTTSTARPAPGATSAATTAPQAASNETIFASLPQSKTPEGYYVLGEPDAPILMEYFSDFL